MVFCNLTEITPINYLLVCHNPYFNRWFSAIGKETVKKQNVNTVTILILIDGFLQ